MKIIFVILSGSVLLPLIATRVSADAVLPLPVVKSAEGPLKVWSRKDRRIVDEATFIAAIARRRFVLLGEVHDNALHHGLRARIVLKINAHRNNVAPNALPPAAVFEHASTDRQPQFDALTARAVARPASGDFGNEEHVADFFKAAQWMSRRWPNSELFAPLVRAVLRSGMPLYAGDVPRQRMMRVARGSSTPQSEALSEAESARLGLDQTLGREENQDALSEIAAAHCGVLPDSMLAPMAYAQRLRDATLADTLIRASEKHGAVLLFAGNGHVRDDRGVPWYIRTRTGQSVVSILFKERQSGTVDNPSVKADVDADRPASISTNQNSEANYVIWTPSRARQDPCLKLKEKYGKTKR